MCSFKLCLGLFSGLSCGLLLVSDGLEAEGLGRQSFDASMVGLVLSRYTFFLGSLTCEVCLASLAGLCGSNLTLASKLTGLHLSHVGGLGLVEGEIGLADGINRLLLCLGMGLGIGRQLRLQATHLVGRTRGVSGSTLEGLIIGGPSKDGSNFDTDGLLPILLSGSGIAKRGEARRRGGARLSGKGLKRGGGGLSDLRGIPAGTRVGGRARVAAGELDLRNRLVVGGRIQVPEMGRAGIRKVDPGGNVVEVASAELHLIPCGLVCPLGKLTVVNHRCLNSSKPWCLWMPPPVDHREGVFEEVVAGVNRFADSQGEGMNLIGFVSSAAMPAERPAHDRVGFAPPSGEHVVAGAAAKPAPLVPRTAFRVHGHAPRPRRKEGHRHGGVCHVNNPGGDGGRRRLRWRAWRLLLLLTL